MTFISYAQNFEDVILRRALKHVDRGFYIDIGANDPAVDSVSLGFYEIGWRGVHVEPMPEYAAKLRTARSDETVVEAALGADEGTITLFEFPGTGLTTGRDDFAVQHANNGHEMRQIEVRVRTLASVLTEIGPRDIHWLKLDVEGMEGAVLRGWREHPVRPWIIVVESTLPNTSTEKLDDFEYELLIRDYEFVYFDGLNRFYVHRDHSELKAAFGPGPNYFDDFLLTEASVFVGRARQQIANHEYTQASVEDCADRDQRRLSAFEKALRSALSAQAIEASEIRAHLNAKITQMKETINAKDAVIHRVEAHNSVLQTAVRRRFFVPGLIYFVAERILQLFGARTRSKQESRS